YSVCQTVDIFRAYLTMTICVVTKTADAINAVEITPQIFESECTNLINAIIYNKTGGLLNPPASLIYLTAKALAINLSPSLTFSANCL
ncbi:MAG: hypothetical protein RI970_499, partial [Pseudomonadota bacterium]